MLGQDTPSAEPVATVDASKSRTQAAKDALRGLPETTAVDQRVPTTTPATGDPIAAEVRGRGGAGGKSTTGEKTRTQEWDEPKDSSQARKDPGAAQSEQAQQAAAAKNRPVYKFEKGSATARLRTATSIAQLNDFYDLIVADFEDSKRELPVEVEALYRDRREAFEQQQEGT
jgi:DNA-binding XRE family transcriptional regulator